MPHLIRCGIIDLFLKGFEIYVPHLTLSRSFVAGLCYYINI